MDNEIDLERYIDTSGRCCPDCQSTGNISYVLIPNSRRLYEGVCDGVDTEFVEYFGPLRDYHCRDCDCEWSMDDRHREA